MTKTLWQSPAIVMLTAAAVVCGTAAYAQTQPTPKAPAAKPQAAKPQAAKPQQAPKKPAANAEPTEQAVLLGQFGDWGAYTATPGGKKVCFALAKPASAVTDPAGRPRDPSYAFVSTRPDEKVKNEVSVIVGFKQKIGHDASASIGSANYPMYTQDDGAWIKNAAEEAQMVDTMRKGADLVIKSVSIKDTKTTDTFSLKGLGQALDKVAEECK